MKVSTLRVWFLFGFGLEATRASLPIIPVKQLDYGYHNYTAMKMYMREFEAYYTDLAHLYSIGRSVKGRDILVMQLSAVPKSKFVGVPNIKLIANIHGDETAGREILLHFLYHLMKGYNELKDRKIIHLLNHYRIHIVPSLNPDGFENSIDGLCANGPGRNNARDVDLNRDFPDYFRSNPIPLQPETRALIDWMNSTQFVLSASLHGGALVVNYPFENTPEDDSTMESSPSIAPDDDVFRHIAKIYAEAHPTMHFGKGCEDRKDHFPGGIVNGAKWYKLTGGMQDYNYAMHGCMEVTLEVGCCKRPLAKELKQYFDDNFQPLIEYCLQAGHSINGQIYDMETKEPLGNAQLMIKGRNITFTTSPSGEFFRMLLPGKYTMLINSPNSTEHAVEFELPEVPKGGLPLMKTITVYLDNNTAPEDAPTTTATALGSSTSEDVSTTWAEETSSTSTEYPIAVCILHNKTEKIGYNVRNEEYILTKSQASMAKFSVLIICLCKSTVLVLFS